jgi:acylphosphatase
MKRLTLYVSGNVQRVGYRARVTEIANALQLQGMVENLDDGRVRIIAEGPEDRLGWFEEAVTIKNTLIQVSSIKKEYSPAIKEFFKFYKLVGKNETDSRLDTAAELLRMLINSVNGMNQNIGEKMERMIAKQDLMITKQEVMIQKQDDTLQRQDVMLQKQDEILFEIKDLNRNLVEKSDEIIEKQSQQIQESINAKKEIKAHLDMRFDKVDGDISRIKGDAEADGAA